MVCPECDSTGLDRRTTDARANWYCRECRARFRDAHRRPAKQPGDHLSGLAKRLHETDTEAL